MSVTISAEEGIPLDPLTEQVTMLLRARHRIQPGDQDDFMVRPLEEMASMLTGHPPRP